MQRRRFLTLAALGLAAPRSALAQPQEPAPSARLGVTAEAWFTDWLDSFYPRALAAGISQPVLDQALGGLSPDPHIAAMDSRQPEFSRPVSDYVRGAVSDARVATGRAKMDALPALAVIEQRFGVPRQVLLGIWAMESNFGAAQGTLDVVRSLATLAALGRRRPWAEGELLAALKIIAAGEAPVGRLTGSWAGAMGQTQFLPSTFLSTAVDGDGDGRRDIWNDPADALASAANLLGKGGWRRGEGWAREMIASAGFDYGLSEGPAQAPAWWAEKGLATADGAGWSAADAEAAGVLLLPSGAQGPAFLALPNHFVIRTYNNALSYALAVGLLADRFAGGGDLRTPWPAETPLSLAERTEAQTALARLGFAPGAADGVIGLATRTALRAWQRTQGLPADGYLSPAVLTRLRAATAALDDALRTLAPS